MTVPYKPGDTATLIRCAHCGNGWADDLHVERCTDRIETIAGLVASAESYGVGEAKVRDLMAHLTHDLDYKTAARDALRVIELGWRPVIGSAT